MFKWLTKSNASVPAAAPKMEFPVPVPEPVLDLETVSELELAVLFKHSRTCPVSWAAKAEVQRFKASHPQVPLFTVVVQEDRELSRRVAEWTGVEHESPQVIVLRRGVLSSHDSHEGVTQEFLMSAATPQG